ncbi:MAG: RMD1 family protein [bacterium]
MTDTLPISGTSITSERGVTQLVPLRAVYFEGQIDLKAFRARHPHYPVLASDPLVIEPERASYIVLTKFGAIVFWNASKQAETDVISAVQDLPGALNRNENVEDFLEVYLGHAEDKVTFNELRLSDLTLEKLKIISLALAKSVALDRFEREIMSALRRFEPVTLDLKSRGVLRLSEQEVLQAVGFVLEVRSAVLANLTLFDAPPETWESEILARLDAQLYDLFDLEERLSAIGQKLDYFAQVNSTLLDILNQRKSHSLEWIIIILIFVEIIFFVLYELLRT